MKCPGQDSQYWKSDAIYEEPCPLCSSPVEFYKDDTTRKCQSCGHRFINPRLDFGCAAYCQYADQCVGNLDDKKRDYSSDLLKNKIFSALYPLQNTDPLLFKHIQQLKKIIENLVKQSKESDLTTQLLLAAGWLSCFGLKYGIDKTEIIISNQCSDKNLATWLKDTVVNVVVQKKALSPAEEIIVKALHLIV